MVLYGLELLPLDEVMRAADPGVLHPWYTDDVDIRGTTRWNNKIFHALTEKGPYHGYFPDPDNSWHICAEGKENYK